MAGLKGNERIIYGSILSVVFINSPFTYFFNTIRADVPTFGAMVNNCKTLAGCIYNFI